MPSNIEKLTEQLNALMDCRKLAAALPLVHPAGTTGDRFYMASSGPSAS
jgi:hypothetical protein